MASRKWIVWAHFWCEEGLSNVNVGTWRNTSPTKWSFLKEVLLFSDCFSVTFLIFGLNETLVRHKKMHALIWLGGHEFRARHWLAHKFKACHWLPRTWRLPDKCLTNVSLSDRKSLARVAVTLAWCASFFYHPWGNWLEVFYLHPGVLKFEALH